MPRPGDAIRDTCESCGADIRGLKRLYCAPCSVRRHNERQAAAAYAAWLAGWEQPPEPPKRRPLDPARLVLGKARWGGKRR